MNILKKKYKIKFYPVKVSFKCKDLNTLLVTIKINQNFFSNSVLFTVNIFYVDFKLFIMYYILYLVFKENLHNEKLFWNRKIIKKRCLSKDLFKFKDFDTVLNTIEINNKFCLSINSFINQKSLICIFHTSFFYYVITVKNHNNRKQIQSIILYLKTDLKHLLLRLLVYKN